MLFRSPVGIAIIAGYILACRFILRPDVSKMREFDITKLQKENSQITPHQKGVLFAFAFALILLLIPGSLPSAWAVTKFFNGMGNASLMIICTVLFTLIKIDDQPLLDFNKAAKMA